MEWIMGIINVNVNDKTSSVKKFLRNVSSQIYKSLKVSEKFKNGKAFVKEGTG
jgi:hypothetical protein